MLVEEKLFGHSHTKITDWIKRNGFKYSGQQGKHPEFTHGTTNYSIPGVNVHKGDVNPKAVANIYKFIKTHHDEHNLTYHPINEIMSFSEYLTNAD